LTATHPRDAGTLPIGVTVELEERADAAWGAWQQARGMKNAGAYPGSHSRAEQRCLGCKRRIVWGERCEKCKQELAARRRRKPR
jgi:hypothetical protein